MVQEVTLRWTAAGGAGGVTVLHAWDSATASDIVTSLGAFITAVRPALATSTSVAIDPVARTKNTVTGTLEGLTTLTVPAPVVGTGGATAVPNLAQGLIRLRTEQVVNGRFLQGRIFVPGMGSSTQNAQGEVNTAGTNALAAAGAALVDSLQWVIWHRPVGGSGGSYSFMSSASAWNEYASQRRRRS